MWEPAGEASSRQWIQPILQAFVILISTYVLLKFWHASNRSDLWARALASSSFGCRIGQREEG
jgi:hypothetical protein